MALWAGAIFLAGIIDGISMAFFEPPGWANPLIIIAFAMLFHSWLMSRERRARGMPQ